MKYGKEITGGIVLIVIQVLISCGIFVTFPQMAAYAVSKDVMELVMEKLNRIETKLDNLTINDKGMYVQKHSISLDSR